MKTWVAFRVLIELDNTPKTQTRRCSDTQLVRGTTAEMIKIFFSETHLSMLDSSDPHKVPTWT